MPVDNVEREIGERVERLMDFLSDLAERFEVVAVDDGSTDATAEVLEELRRRIPQLRVKRLASTLGPAAAAAEGLPLAGGDFIFLHESYGEIDAQAVRQLWGMRSDRELVLARVECYRSEVDVEAVGWLSRLAAGLRPQTEKTAAPPSRKPTGQLQMLRRDAVERAVANPSHLSRQRNVRSEVQGVDVEGSTRR